LDLGLYLGLVFLGIQFARSASPFSFSFGKPATCGMWGAHCKIKARDGQVQGPGQFSGCGHLHMHMHTCIANCSQPWGLQNTESMAVVGTGQAAPKNGIN